MKRAVVFCALVTIAAAFLDHVKLEPIPEKFENQTGCYIEELDVVIPFSKSVPSKERCVEYRCNTNLITVAGCSVVVATPPCKVVEDKLKQYPACCATIECTWY